MNNVWILVISTWAIAAANLQTQAAILTRTTRLKRGYPASPLSLSPIRFESQLTALNVRHVEEWTSLMTRVCLFTSLMLVQVGILSKLHHHVFRKSDSSVKTLVGKLKKTVDDAAAQVKGKNVKSVERRFHKAIRNFSDTPSFCGVSVLIDMNVELANLASNEWRSAIKEISKRSSPVMDVDSDILQYIMAHARSEWAVTSAVAATGDSLVSIDSSKYFTLRFLYMRVAHIAAGTSFQACIYVRANPSRANIGKCEALLRSSQASVNRFYVTCAEFDKFALEEGGQLKISKLLEQLLAMDTRQQERVRDFIKEISCRM